MRTHSPVIPFVFSVLAIASLQGCVSMGGNTSENASTSSADSSRGGISDSDAVSAIQDAFKQDALLSTTSLSVRAEKGVATLSGQVPSAQAYNRAISLARSVTGRPPVATGLTFP